MTRVASSSMPSMIGDERIISFSRSLAARRDLIEMLPTDHGSDAGQVVGERRMYQSQP